MRKIIGIFLLALIAVNAIPRPVTATTPAPQTLSGSFQTVNNGPNDQTAPDLDCNLMAYINDDHQGSSMIHYLSAPGNPDIVIPGNGLDSQPDVGGNLIAFTELGAQSTGVAVFNTLLMMRTDIAGTARSNPALGGDLVAYEDRSFFAAPNQSEIGVYDLSTDIDIRLTNDLLFDKNPAMSPTGNSVVWEKCQTDGFNCNIYAALQTSPGVFTTRALTSAVDNRNPDTNGQIAVYISNRSGENDIYYQPLAGGSETRIAIPGDQRDLSISGNLIAFESQLLPNQTEYDIFVYDLNTATLYRVTNTPNDEFSTRITFCNGVGRIVYVSPGTDWDVYSFTFQLPPPPPPPPSPVDEINALIAQVRSYHLLPSLETTLVSNLQQALAAVNANNTAGACSSMSSFISKVQSQSDKKVDPVENSEMINLANQIKTHLGCP